MKIYSLTTRQNQFEEWRKSIDESFELIRLDHDTFARELQSLKEESLVMVDLVSCKDRYVKTVIESKPLLDTLKVIALSNIPNIHECIGLMAYGIKAYGHNLMAPALFSEMLAKVVAGQMWFPELIMDDLVRVALYSSEQPQKLDSIDLLTPREQDVAYYVAQGKSNKEIAVILDLSADTVKLHLNHIYKKLNIDNRVSLALKLKI
jgi:DNA-binding NarL/FixJ family response regulator